MVYTDGIRSSVYTDWITDEIYKIWREKMVWWRGGFCWQFYRGIQTGVSVQWHDQFTVRITDGIIEKMSPLVIPSTKVNISPLCRPSPPLFLLLLFHPNSPLPNCKQLPPQKKFSSSQQKSYFFKFYSHIIRVLIYCGFYYFL